MTQASFGSSNAASVARPGSGLTRTTGCAGAVGSALGVWSPGAEALQALAIGLGPALRRVSHPVFIVGTDDGPAVAQDGCAALGSGATAKPETLPLLGYAAPLSLSRLGDPSFCADHGLRFAYVSGAMANGIGSVAIAREMARVGMLGVFGAAGLAVERVRAAIDELQTTLNGRAFGMNLIHSPNEPHLEAEIAALYLDRGIRLVEASAYLGLTLPIVRYRVAGIHEDADGRIVTPNRVLAKVSRVEVAARFMAPPPEKFLAELVAEGFITESQARMAQRVPLAQDITAEADSGGHTDNRPALALVPTLIALRDRMQSMHGYSAALRVGAAGGIATPAAAAAAFGMGAAYVVVGSIHQACQEAGTSDLVRAMLAEAEQADTAMAPAADMFEMGVRVQVLKRGTLFAPRAQKLYDLYRAYGSLEELPATERASLEKTILRASIDEVWAHTKRFFEHRDPSQIERAEREPKHRMALVFRWYLGKASNWANAGVADRKIDYQVWCGPGMGAFNEWVRGSFLEPVAARRVSTVALNLLYGAAVCQRIASLRSQGVSVPPEAAHVTPTEPEVILEHATP
ncbi:MAG: PfaD family polyunsaturated fatty acid/polyketide biosynthesis protein [Planctomycetota bacterium]